MPKKLPQYLEYFLEDCLWWNSEYTTKWMFGGHGIYKNGVIFWLYAYDEIYFKIGESNVEDYKQAWSHPFEYDKAGKVMELSYYTLPEEIFENREELDKWIEKSLKISQKSKKAPKKSKKDKNLDTAILKALLEIPKWKVTTYKILADKFDVHPRRIASVMKYNKAPESIPCYKVISHSRKVWGYSALEWQKSKIELIENDGIEIIDGKIPAKFIYQY